MLFKQDLPKKKSLKPLIHLFAIHLLFQNTWEPAKPERKLTKMEKSRYGKILSSTYFHVIQSKGNYWDQQ